MLYNTLQLLNNALIKQIVCLICRSLAEWHQFSRKKIDERKKINSFRDQTMNKKVCYDDFQAPLSFWKNTTLRWRRKSSQKNPETDYG